MEKISNMAVLGMKERMETGGGREEEDERENK